jgi:hypothetical protein
MVGLDHYSNTKQLFMFRQIFLFELKYRFQRPAAYLYFLFFFAAGFLAFANGALPLQEKEFYNAPAALALYSTVCSIFMMLASSSIMGVPLYRDIEHNTKDYYLSYPITKPGYFWGRFLGSFFFVLLIGSAVYWGAWAGTFGGPAFGWSQKSSYQPFHFYHYLYPYFTLVLPNLFFTSALFFGLVAIFRNVKVIYSSGLFLFLGYIISNFFFQNTSNTTVIFLWDPFAFTPLRMLTNPLPPEILNSSVIHIRGLLLANRILWTSIGLVFLLGTYWRFSFERFFAGPARAGRYSPSLSGSRTGAASQSGGSRTGAQDGGARTVRQIPAGGSGSLQVQFTGGYPRKVLYTLTRIEILNIIRDNYFWIILSGGLGFLGFLFWNSFRPYNVEDFPRSVFFVNVFVENFRFFLFFIILFYTGETVHRERITRYAFINDSLPPPNWVLGSAKVLSLLALALFLSLVPMLLGVIVQTLKGYHQYNFPAYFTSLFGYILPNLIEMVLFSYVVQVIVPNKFAGYGIGITIWILLYFANDLGYFTYLLLLYGNTPQILLSDMDLAGHLLTAVVWFHSYWLLAGCCLLVVAALFFNRGTNSSFKERLSLARGRYRGRLRLTSLVLLAGYLAIAIYIYYNVSVLNVYLTHHENDQRRALAEKGLKHFESLPLPTVTRMRMQVDLFPEAQRALNHAVVTIRNNGEVAIDTLLLDGDNLTDYTLRYKGALLSYRCPLFFPRGKFNIFRPAKDSSDYRLYVLPAPLMPGDTALVDIHSRIEYTGFRNEWYGLNMLHNGTFYTEGLPGLGYDDDEELRKNDKRKEYGLAPKIDHPVPHNDPAGMRHLDISSTSSLIPLDITVGTAGDQWAVGPGRLEKEWSDGGRHYFHYVLDTPGLYPPFGILSARFAHKQALVPIAGGLPVRLTVYYHPAHAVNVGRFMAANTDGLQYLSAHYGTYPFGDLSLAESPIFGPSTGNFTGVTLVSERFGWNASFTNSRQFDYLYYTGVEQLANQWWGRQVAPNHTAGSRVVADGLSKYTAIVLTEKRYGKEIMSDVRFHDMNDYVFIRRRNFHGENTLLYADDWSKWSLKAGIVLYGLRDLIGEDSLNAALREFCDAWKFRKEPPYAGVEDLYRVLQKHVPDSFRYYLTDTWEKLCLYDNKVVAANAVAAGAGNYRVTIKVSVNKVYINSARQEHPARGMKDYIDIGVYGAGHKELYFKKLPFAEGEHTIALLVPGKPVTVAIDPVRKLIDRIPEDNRKEIPNP